MNRAEYAAWRRNNHPEGLTCDHDDRALYAKGLCWPHYKTWRRSGYVIGPTRPPGQWSKHPPLKCDQCGAKRPKSKGGPNGKLCTACKLARTCVECGSDFTATWNAEIFCSDACRPDNYWQWWAKRNPEQVTEGTARRRARKQNNGRVERFWRKKVYERDNWQCGICNQPVNPELEWPHPQSASLDHIVPLAQGGEHTRANVRLAHLHCNTSRGVGNYDSPIQLALI